MYGVKYDLYEIIIQDQFVSKTLSLMCSVVSDKTSTMLNLILLNICNLLWNPIILRLCFCNSENANVLY